MMAEIFPSYTLYEERAKAHREIPVVVLEQRQGGVNPCLSASSA